MKVHFWDFDIKETVNFDYQWYTSTSFMITQYVYITYGYKKICTLKSVQLLQIWKIMILFASLYWLLEICVLSEGSGTWTTLTAQKNFYLTLDLCTRPNFTPAWTRWLRLGVMIRWSECGTSADQSRTES